MKTRIKGSKILIKTYTHSPKFVKTIIESYLLYAESGWYFSETLREIYNKVYGIKIGMGSYGCFVPSRFPQGTQIGSYCSIARNVTVLNANHPMNNASMHPLFYDKRLGADARFALERVNLSIGNDVWIGQDVIITKGCKKIGNGSIIGAGSIVTKDVLPYSIIAGNPAKEIRKRFSEDITHLLEESRWYDLSPDQLKTIADYIDQPLLFANKAKEMTSHEHI